MGEIQARRWAARLPDNSWAGVFIKHNKTTTWAGYLRAAAAIVCCVVIAGCETLPGRQAAQDTPPPADVTECTDTSTEARCVCLREGQGSLACRCAEAPDRIECTLCKTASAPKLRTEGLIALSGGSYASAGHLLRCALDKQPGDARAEMLLAQLDDPTDFFEQQFGSAYTTYTMREGDTLGIIAQRCLGNPMYFIGLALINDLTNPSRVPVGRSIRVPGTTTCEPRKVAGSTSAPAQPSVGSEASGSSAAEEDVLSVDATPRLIRSDGGASTSAAQARPSDQVDAVEAAASDLASSTERLLDEFTDLLLLGKEQEGCSKLREVLQIDPENEAALQNQRDFCNGDGGR